MTRPLVTIYDADGSFITREMNDEEYAQWEIDFAAAEAAKSAAEQAEAKRAESLAKLAVLGLTTDDLKALGLGGN